MQHSLSVKSSNSEIIYRFAVTEISYGVYKEITPQGMYHNLLL